MGTQFEKRRLMMERIEQHGRNLAAIFLNATKQGYKLCAALRRLELAATRLTVAACNGEIANADAADWDAQIDAIEAKTRNLLGLTPGRAVEIGLFVNRDPRGYALKLSSEWTDGYQRGGGKLHQDMGGYGILAPDYRED